MLYQFLWRWAKCCHHNKGKWRISTNYWHTSGNRTWVFSTEDKELIRVDYISIVRHIKVRMNANPYFDKQYFIDRKFEQNKRRLSGKFKRVWENQKGCCYYCKLPMKLSEDREIFFKIKDKNVKYEVPNMAYVHKHCQKTYLEFRS